MGAGFGVLEGDPCSRWHNRPAQPDRNIAEFVEDAETMEMLRDYGVDAVQGFHIGGRTGTRSRAARRS
jgi:hypothetical protein